MADMVGNTSVELTEAEVSYLLEMLESDLRKNEPVGNFGKVIPTIGLNHLKEPQRPAAPDPNLPQIRRALHNKIKAAQAGAGQSGVFPSRNPC
jgi:hypothetical protein